MTVGERMCMALARMVQRRLEVTVATMRSPSRKRDDVWARAVAMWLIREATECSYPSIGRFFNRDHSTVIHACKRVAGEAKGGARANFLRNALHDACMLVQAATARMNRDRRESLVASRRLAANVRTLRTGAQMTQAQLAEAIGRQAGQRFVGRIEACHNVELRTVERLALALGVSPHELLLPIDPAARVAAGLRLLTDPNNLRRATPDMLGQIATMLADASAKEASDDA